VEVRKAVIDLPSRRFSIKGVLTQKRKAGRGNGANAISKN
jgi:hypothetical protein